MGLYGEILFSPLLLLGDETEFILINIELGNPAESVIRLLDNILS